MTSRFWSVAALVVVLLCGASACRRALAPGAPVENDAGTFLSQANETMLRLSNEANQAGWVQSTHITPDTEAIAARAGEAYMTAVTDFAKRAAGYDQVQL